jgi:hypothetical protein
LLAQLEALSSSFLPRLGDLYQRLANNTHKKFDRILSEKENKMAQFEAKALARMI